MRSRTLATSRLFGCVSIHAGAQQYTLQRSIGLMLQVGDLKAIVADKLGPMYVADQANGHMIVVPGKNAAQ
jgi:hypothetical protein